MATGEDVWEYIEWCEVHYARTDAILHGKREAILEMGRRGIFLVERRIGSYISLVLIVS